MLYNRLKNYSLSLQNVNIKSIQQQTQRTHWLKGLLLETTE